MSESGDVTDVRAMKGRPSCTRCASPPSRRMRFKPALDADGKPVVVVRYMKFHFQAENVRESGDLR